VRDYLNEPEMSDRQVGEYLADLYMLFIKNRYNPKDNFIRKTMSTIKMLGDVFKNSGMRASYLMFVAMHSGAFRFSNLLSKKFKAYRNSIQKRAQQF